MTDAADHVGAPGAGESGDPSEGQLTPAGDQMEALFGISFDGPLRAQEFFLALNRLSTTGHLVLRDAVVVVKDEEGKVRVRESIDPQPGKSAMSGAVWSGLFGLLLGGPVGWLAGLGIGAGAGALIAKVVDVGIPDEWVVWFQGCGAAGHGHGRGACRGHRPRRCSTGKRRDFPVPRSCTPH